MRKTLDGVRWLIDRWSMRRYERARNRDGRQAENGGENLARARKGIYQRGDGGG
ncbi:MAG: hypothetical protein ABWZ91_12630 [Nocardioides sp.]